MIKIFKEIKNKISKNLSNFTSGMLTPAAILTFAGVVLSVSNILIQYGPSENAQYTMWINVLKDIGQIFFNLIPFMFTISIIASFTKAAYAVFSGAIAWLSLLLFSSTMIMWKDNIPYSLGLFEINANVDSILGFRTIDPGIVWAFIVSAIQIKIWNKFKDIKFHKYFAFWEGHRFIPFMTVIIMLPISVLYMFIWPGIGAGMYKFGNIVSKSPGGLNSFLFYGITYTLLPFGLHHFFTNIFHVASAGGELTGFESFNIDYVDKTGFTWAAGTPIYLIFNKVSNFDPSILPGNKSLGGIFSQGSIKGDWALMQNLQSNAQVKYGMLKDNLQAPNNINAYRNMLEGVGKTSFSTDSINLVQKISASKIDYTSYVYNGGKYVAGEAFLTWFGAPGAALAMILVAPKDKRKKIASLFIGGLVSWFFGISEPFVYTFLFTAPILYFGILVPLLAMSGLTANIMESHYFGEQIVMYVTTGIIPGIIGQDTNFYNLFIAGPAFFIVGFCAYYFVIKKFNLKTPGREGTAIRFATKEEGKAKLKEVFNKKKESSRKKNKKIDTQDIDSLTIIKGLGGEKNIGVTMNCASRLRVDIKDKTKVDESIIKKTGAYGIVWIGDKHLQIIYGPTVTRIRSSVDKELEKMRI